MRPLLLIAFLFSISSLFAQSADTSFFVTNGRVDCFEKHGNTLYVGGYFTRIGPNIPYSAWTDTLGGSIKVPFTNGPVYTAVPDLNGGFYIGGSFRKIGNVSRSGIAHIDAAGNVSAWSPVMDSLATVSEIIVAGNTIYIAGGFNLAGGQPRQNIAALDAVTGTATAWNPTVNSPVSTIALLGNALYIGGGFTLVNGQARNYAAAVDTGAGSLMAWNPNPDSAIIVLVEHNGKLYAGGRFSIIGGQQRGKIAAIDPITGAVASWNPNANGGVFDIEPAGSALYVSGRFTNIGGQSRNYLARIDTVNGFASPWNPDPDGDVYEVAVDGARVCIGGNFFQVGGQSREKGAIIDTAGTLLAWDPRADYIIRTILPQGQDIFVGGDFVSLGVEDRRNLGAIDLVSRTVTSWNPSPDQPIRALKAFNTTLFVAGDFSNIGGQARTFLASFDVPSGSITPWAPALSNVVACMETKDSILFIGGYFNLVNSQSRLKTAAFDINTGNLMAWHPNVAGYAVEEMVVHDSLIYIGGLFNTVDGQARGNIAAVSAVTGNVTSWNPNANNWVHAISIGWGKVYVGGAFSLIGGQARNRVAAIDLVSGGAYTWNPNANSNVNTLSLLNGTVYAGGGFTAIGGQTRIGIAALDAISGDALGSWDASIGSVFSTASSTVSTIFPTSSSLYIGGIFRILAGVPSANLAVLSPDISNFISGKVFYDMNGNGARDTLEPVMPGVMINIQPGNYYCSSDGSGLFMAHVDTGNYALTPVLPNYATASVPVSHQVSFNAYQQAATSNDFGMQMIPNVNDLSVDLTAITWARPGFPLEYMITYRNAGTATQSGSIKLILDQNVSYQNSTPAHTQVSGDTVFWSYANLALFESRSIRVHLQVPPNVTLLGDTLKSLVQINPIAGDTSVTNNYDTLSQVVTGSYDPNDKSVYPAGHGLQGIVPNNTDTLVYIIRFQNTGTDTAFTVVIKDTLDPDLDAASFTMISASHDYTFNIQNGLVTFTFNNILLPDSNVNESASHGFIKYSVRPLSNPAQGTVINNTAYIYFDYNSPVITNTTYTTLLDTPGPGALGEIIGSREVKVYPNPFSDYTTIKVLVTDDCTCDLTLYDQWGRMVEKITNIKGEPVQLNRKNLDSGMYYYILRGKAQEVTGKGKVVIQ